MLIFVDAALHCQVSRQVCRLQVVILVDAVCKLGPIACRLASVPGACVFLAVFKYYLTQICKVWL